MGKNEFKVKIGIRLKKMSEDEYSIVAGLWKRCMIDFEEALRANLRANKLDYKTFKNIDKGFDFASLAAFKVPILPLTTQEQATHGLKEPTQPQVVVEEKIDIVETAPSPVSAGPDSTHPPDQTIVTALDSSPKPAIDQIPPSTTPVKTATSTQETHPSLKTLTGLTRSSSRVTRPEEPAEPLITPTPGIPKVPTIEGPSPSRPLYEEDRATGIAILRQQMLSELKKIRGIIETKEEK